METTGKCPHCGINVYGVEKKPNIKYMPCGVNGCPYETVEEQKKNPFVFNKISGDSIYDNFG
jgi:hypothetical protein